ncbi:tRNA (N(6)-L-threonylcarbamoyladenosine(37)-C(2))-methylthiotransferase [Methanococcus voltae]|uniref:tRNA (N(6)-L-threonylcarbamoyladenosine(37)-C(2))- methylthiotransferase n=1 Tax=Methanococcus voltae TaxID=2188 RepID=UPI001FD987ED|nr:tRNA (N(6)-L-threonylcarbamoyladenosine(37)-C(2))-methylthiotransferase [Methanococcus voltae]MBP2172917.1 MiaB-like tRNA modifying enzyme [Methanococcus voltae]
MELNKEINKENNKENNYSNNKINEKLFNNLNVHLEGYGCTLNTSDTEIIKNSMIEQGFNVYTGDFKISDSENINLVVINTCIVRQETEHKMISKIKKYKESGKKVVVAGCLAKALSKKIEGLYDALIMPREAHLSGEIVKAVFEGKDYQNIVKTSVNTIDNKLNYLAKDNTDNTHNKVNSSNNLIMALPICEGCLGNCTYCIVKVARGNLISYEPKNIVKKSEELLKSGTKCLLVTAQDTACYGFDRDDNYRLPNLINDIVNNKNLIDNTDENKTYNFGVRIGMMHANYANSFIDDLIETYSNEKVTKFLHLPIQSGDNEVLKDMNRGYTVDEFISVLDEFKHKVKDLNFTTDIIVGFPTESEEAFENTLEVLKQIKPDFTHGAKYSQRKYTVAGRMKQIDTKIRKERSEILNKLRREISFENNKKHIGQTFECLIVKEGEAITNNCKKVLFDSPDDAEISIGEFKTVKVTGAGTFGLQGKLLN